MPQQLAESAGTSMYAFGQKPFVIYRSGAALPAEIRDLAAAGVLSVAMLMVWMTTLCKVG